MERNIVLGLNLSHDTSVALIKDGKIYAAEEERWSKIKHNTFDRKDDYLFPKKALEYVLKESDTDISDIKHVVCVSMSTNDKLGDNINLKKELKSFKNISFISHHKAHILSGYLLSPFNEAIGICYDGAGSMIGLDFNCRERITGYYLKNNTIQKIYNIFDSIKIDNGDIRKIKNSLGIFYYNFAIRCIPKGNEAEGSMMALSSYSNSNKYYKKIKKLIKLLPNGQFQIEYPYSTKNNDIYYFGKYSWSIDNNENIPFDERANLAFAVQKVFEETILHILNYLHSITNIKNLVISGGCALNSKLNGKIQKYTKFENIYIPPAPNDGGVALGAALYGWNFVLGKERIKSPVSVDWGEKIQELSKTQIDYLKENNYTIRKEKEIYKQTAKLLNEKKIILWARGGMEFGPRALGNRSIICHPGDLELSKRLNVIKNRASYRPLAPSIIDKRFKDYFLGDADYYMNKVSYVKDTKKLCGVVHKDASARVQLVSPQNEFYNLLLEFEKLSNLPVIINTSLNLKGIPIARSTSDVLQILEELSVDGAVIGNYIIEKVEQKNVNYVSVIVEEKEYKIICKDKTKINLAINFIQNLYKNRKRDQGTNFINHPLNVVQVLQKEFKINLSDDLIVVALLHDALWIDFESTKNDIMNIFGIKILKNIKRLTKPHILKNTKKTKNSDKKFFKKISKLNNNLIYIKLADRLDNLRDIKFCNEEKQIKFIKSTKKYYLKLIKSKQKQKKYSIIYYLFKEALDEFIS